MNRAKKIIIALLIAIIFIGNISISIFASTSTISGQFGENINYVLSESGVLTISGFGDMKNYTQSPWGDFADEIKSVEIKSRITSIGNYAFKDCINLTSVSIPNSVTSIGESAFEGCSSLTIIDIPDGVETINDAAFKNCINLTSVTIPNSVTSIGEFAFEGCSSLTIIDIPNGVKTINGAAFKDCINLTDVHIGIGVNKIGGGAFANCGRISNLYIKSVDSWCNISFLNVYANPLATNDLHKRLYLNGELVTNLVIPENVTKIPDFAFSYCNDIESVTFNGNAPENVRTTIASKVSRIYYYENKTGFDSAEFGFVYLTPLHIGEYQVVKEADCLSEGLRTIDCEYCNKHIEEIIPIAPHKFINGKCTGCNIESSDKAGECGDNVTYVLDENGVLTISGYGEMYNYSYGFVNGVYTIDRPWMNYIADIKSVKITKGVTTIGNYAFCKCTNLKNVEIADSVKSIGDVAFSGCTGLESIVLPDSVKYIRRGAFEGCTALKTITLPNSVTDIGSGLFSGCSSLKSVAISNKMTNISSSMFSGCYRLADIVIPDSISRIEDGAFNDCINLKSILFKGNAPAMGSAAFTNVNNNLIIYYYDGKTGFDTGVLTPFNLVKLENNNSQVTISGNVVAYGSESETVNIKLVNMNNSDIAFSSSFVGNNGTYEFVTDVMSGTYKLEVSKTGAVTREYTITVGTSNVTQNVLITVMGDVNQDGNVKTTDALMVQRHIIGSQSLDSYQMKLANPNGDSTINTTDALWIQRKSIGL